MDDVLTINEHLVIPLTEITFSASRASGPGGQHVNKAETRIQLRWNPSRSVALAEADRELVCDRLAARLTATGDIILACGSHRSQRRNRQACLDRLARLLRAALVPVPPRHKTRPTSGSREKRLQQKKQRSDTKQRRRKPTGDD